MAVFAIISETPKPELRSAVERVYAGNFRHWSDRTSFVIAPGPAKTVAESVGVQSAHPDGGVIPGIPDVVVTELAPSFWGWTGADFWQWLKSAHERSGA